jgi:hypothetical protein
MGTHPWGWMLPTRELIARAERIAGFNGHPPLGVDATCLGRNRRQASADEFQWAPTLGGGCYVLRGELDEILDGVVSMGTHPWGWMLLLTNPSELFKDPQKCFNGHPPLGVDATSVPTHILLLVLRYQVSMGTHPWGWMLRVQLYHMLCVGRYTRFQWAPTLGGGCYNTMSFRMCVGGYKPGFNGHPPLGVDATRPRRQTPARPPHNRFNGHPPLGVDATHYYTLLHDWAQMIEFQWAPTLGGGCYMPWNRRYTMVIAVKFQWAPTLGGGCYNYLRSRHLETQLAVVSMGTHPWGWMLRYSLPHHTPPLSRGRRAS